ncbi:13471_t:CDS:1, partial [Dentiscutata erythropus]
TNNAYSSFIDIYPIFDKQGTSESFFDDLNKQHNREKIIEIPMNSEDEGEDTELKYSLAINQTFEGWESTFSKQYNEENVVEEILTDSEDESSNEKPKYSLTLNQTFDT